MECIVNQLLALFDFSAFDLAKMIKIGLEKFKNSFF